jgi:hypothetical protein
MLRGGRVYPRFALPNDSWDQGADRRAGLGPGAGWQEQGHRAGGVGGAGHDDGVQAHLGCLRQGVRRRWRDKVVTGERQVSPHANPYCRRRRRRRCAQWLHAATRSGLGGSRSASAAPRRGAGPWLHLGQWPLDTPGPRQTYPCSSPASRAASHCRSRPWWRSPPGPRPFGSRAAASWRQGEAARCCRTSTWPPGRRAWAETPGIGGAAQGEAQAAGWSRTFPRQTWTAPWLRRLQAARLSAATPQLTSLSSTVMS